MACSLRSYHPLQVMAYEGEVDWSLLVSWILWLYCGFFSLGTLAGELEQPSNRSRVETQAASSHPHPD